MAEAIHQTGLAEELRSAIRSFESGRFEEAARALVPLVRQDPNDTEAAYLLRRIERRLAAIPPSGTTTLIWQVDPTKVWEGEWVRTLLEGSVQSEVVDGTWSAMAPRMVVVDNGLTPSKRAYYRKAFDRGSRIVLVHLSDEGFSDDRGAYQYCEAILRNYRSEILAADRRVESFPLGFKSGFARETGPARTAPERRQFWSFAGDPMKSTRRPMLEAMGTLERGYVHLTSGFGSSDCLSTDRYRALLEETLLVPCPGGWTNLETFRVYEALEAGCIPIVERRPSFDYFTDLLGNHPLPTIGDWSEVQELFGGRSREELEPLRQSCESWWRAFKRRLRSTVTATVRNSLP